jgi:hypothetical protein
MNERRRNRYARFAIVAGVLAGAMQTAADEAISITVRPTIVMYPGNAQLKVLVARDEKNRELVLEVDGPSYYRSSSMDLSGASAPRSYQFMTQNLPSGEFEVRATVRRNDRSAASDRRTLKVIGGPSSDRDQ